MSGWGLNSGVASNEYGYIITDFFLLLMKNTAWRICGFNKMVLHATQCGFIARDFSWPRNSSSWRYQLATNIMRFDTIRPFVASTRKNMFMKINFNSWALKHKHLWSYGWDTAQYVSKSVRKLPQKNQCLQFFAWRSNFTIKKNIIKKNILYVFYLNPRNGYIHT